MLADQQAGGPELQRGDRKRLSTMFSIQALSSSVAAKRGALGLSVQPPHQIKQNKTINTSNII